MHIVKKMLKQGINSFCYSIAITTVVYLFFMYFGKGFIPMLPEFMAHFATPVHALAMQLLLIGCMSAAFGGGGVLLELERIPLLIQSLLYLLITSAVWIPIADFCWNFSKYPQALFGILGSYLASYIICWTIQYRLCKKNVEEINKKLEKIQNEEKR